MVGTVNLTVQQCPGQALVCTLSSQLDDADDRASFAALTPSQKEQARLALESGLSNAPPTRAPPPDQPGAQEFPPLQSVEGGAATSPQTPPASSSNSLEPESPETPTPRPRHGAATSLLTGRPIEIKTGLPTRAAAPKSGTASDATSAGLPKSYRLALATPVSRARALNSGSSLICEAGASRIIPVSGVPTRSSQKGACHVALTIPTPRLADALSSNAPQAQVYPLPANSQPVLRFPNRHLARERSLAQKTARRPGEVICLRAGWQRPPIPRSLTRLVNSRYRVAPVVRANVLPPVPEAGRRIDSPICSSSTSSLLFLLFVLRPSLLLLLVSTLATVYRRLLSLVVSTRT